MGSAERLVARLRARQGAARAQRGPSAGVWPTNGTVALVSDLHVPLVSTALLERLLVVIARERVRELVVCGDLLDQEAFSSHPPGLARPQADFRDDLALAGDILRAILDAGVERLYVMPGNHDVRVLRHLHYQLGMRELVRVILPEAGLGDDGIGRFTLGGRMRQLVVTELPRLELRVAGERWVLLHPRTYSRVRGRVATQFADLECANVAVGHVHHLHQGLSSNGRWWAVELGGLLDPQLLSYPAEQPSPGTAMTTGFVLLERGVPRLVGGGVVAP